MDYYYDFDDYYYYEHPEGEVVVANHRDDYPEKDEDVMLDRGSGENPFARFGSNTDGRFGIEIDVDKTFNRRKPLMTRLIQSASKDDHWELRTFPCPPAGKYLFVEELERTFLGNSPVEYLSWDYGLHFHVSTATDVPLSDVLKWYVSLDVYQMASISGLDVIEKKWGIVLEDSYNDWFPAKEEDVLTPPYGVGWLMVNRQHDDGSVTAEFRLPRAWWEHQIPPRVYAMVEIAACLAAGDFSGASAALKNL